MIVGDLMIDECDDCTEDYCIDCWKKKKKEESDDSSHEDQK